MDDGRIYNDNLVEKMDLLLKRMNDIENKLEDLKNDMQYLLETTNVPIITTTGTNIDWYQPLHRTLRKE